MKKRFIVEGTWSGYGPSQSRVVHRTVERSDDFPRCIRYTDGTCLFLSIREAEPGERVKEIHGYDELIHDCRRAGVSSVAALNGIDEARRG